ncbi:hypothetical protein JOB18_009309 [Solea senegalensis]|uniref:Uncharacterized protein n=1 Tax=Solea senegalensis TaxID=28829 RepID=A0AAV6QH10_SOLSE|nr:hypothetical protein JOB18_009309 [Solea senegalensis]
MAAERAKRTSPQLLHVSGPHSIFSTPSPVDLLLCSDLLPSPLTSVHHSCCSVAVMDVTEILPPGAQRQYRPCCGPIVTEHVQCGKEDVSCSSPENSSRPPVPVLDCNLCVRTVQT